MQSPIFVFAGYKKEDPDGSLFSLSSMLTKVFEDQNIDISFSKKDRLINARYSNLSVYISIFDDEHEVEDWCQMAKDFKLTVNTRPVEGEDFENRIRSKQQESPNLYQDIDYKISRSIYSQLSKLKLTHIYFFC